MHSASLESSTSSLPVTEFDAVGVNIAKKLQRMHSTQAIFAESIINEVLMRGLLNKLTDSTKLSDEFLRQAYSSPYDSGYFSRPPSTSTFSYRDMSQSSTGQAQYSQNTTANNNSQSQVIMNLDSSSDSTATLFYESCNNVINK